VSGDSNQPGRGGVSRGRADATLGFTGETPGRADVFEARELPPAEYLDPQASAVVGIGATAPEVDPEGESGGSLTGGVSAGRASWKRRVAPRHRQAVQSFFAPPARTDRDHEDH